MPTPLATMPSGGRDGVTSGFVYPGAPASWLTTECSIACWWHPVSLDTHLSRGETGTVKSNMNEIDRRDAVDGPVVSEGGAARPRCPRAAPPRWRPLRRSPALAPGQRWSFARKREAVVAPDAAASPPSCSPASSACPCSKLSTGARRLRLRLEARCRSARPIPPTTNSPRPCSGSASSAWRSSCCARRWSGQRPFGRGGRR